MSWHKLGSKERIPGNSISVYKPVRMFYDPPVVDVLEVITRDLLLVGGAAFVRVA